MKQTQRRAMRYALTAVALWSTVASAFKLSLRYLSPQELLFWASAASLLFYTLLLWRTGRLKEALETMRRHGPMLGILGLLNPFVYYLLLFGAYARLPAQEAQSINYSWGILLALLSVPVLGHPLRRRDLLAGLICYAGVVIIATRGDLAGLHFSDPVGVGLALASTLVWAIYWLLSTRIALDPLIVLFTNFSVGTLLLALWLLLHGGIAVPPLHGALGALYVGLFEMGLSFVLWLRALRLAPRAASVSNLIYLSPFLSLLLIHLIVGEEILFSTVIGLGMILLGLFVQKIR